MMTVKSMLGLSLGLFVFSSVAVADPVVIRAYKQAFPDTKPKCINCHKDALPKKAEGKHEWNAYGKTLKKVINEAGVADVPTFDDVAKIVPVLQKIGKVEDFKDTTAQ